MRLEMRATALLCLGRTKTTSGLSIVRGRSSVVLLKSLFHHARMPIRSPRYSDEPSLVALGQAIRRVRKIHGISQEALAHQTEIDRSYMSSIERGQQNPGVMTVFRISTVLKMTAAELLAEANL